MWFICKNKSHRSSFFPENWMKYPGIGVMCLNHISIYNRMRFILPPSAWEWVYMFCPHFSLLSFFMPISFYPVLSRCSQCRILWSSTSLVCSPRWVNCTAGYLHDNRFIFSRIYESLYGNRDEASEEPMNHCCLIQNILFT